MITSAKRLNSLESEGYEHSELLAIHAAKHGGEFGITVSSGALIEHAAKDANEEQWQGMKNSIQEAVEAFLNAVRVEFRPETKKEMN